MSTALRKWLPRVAAAGALAWVGGCFLVNRAVDESYSSGWYSATTENARYRKVFVASPIVVPGVLTLGDSVELHVVDAWVERPTHVEYRWLVLRREVQDAGYRLVVHLAQLPRDTAAWSYARGRCFVSADFEVDGEAPTISGNGDVQILVARQEKAFGDTVHLAAHAHGPTPGVRDAPAACRGL